MPWLMLALNFQVADGQKFAFRGKAENRKKFIKSGALGGERVRSHGRGRPVFSFFFPALVKSQQT